MSAESSRAVFLSYASQDAEAAKKICEALRATGVEVWFDQSELVGGDSWDQKIRGQIGSCALFVPLISANTQARLEGYFRLEWKLAAQRTHTMADEKTFLLPVVIDATRDVEAKVPAEFKSVQWTKLPGGETPEKFCARVKHLLGGGVIDVGPVADRAPGHRPGLQPKRPPSRSWGGPAIAGVALLIAIAAFFALRLDQSAPPPAPTPKNSASTSAAPASPAPAPAATFPHDAELRRAWSLFQSASSTEDFALAEDILKAAIARQPTDPETVIVYAWLHNNYINRGFDVSEERYVLGRRYAERAVQLAANEPEALAALGQFLAFRGADLARAEQLLRRAIELNPREPRFYRALGYNVLRFLRPAEVVAFAERTVELFPNDALVHYELGLHYRDVGRMADMEREFDRCLALAPISAAMIWKSWIAGWVHGDLAGMKEWLDRIPADSRLTDRAIIVRYQLAVMAQQPAELADALRTLQAVPGTTLRDFYYTGPKALLIGDVYAAQGKRELAKGQYEVALTEIARDKISARDDFNVLTAEIWTLIGLGRRDEALAALRLLVSSSPTDPRFVRWWFDLMPACLLLGARDLALEQFKLFAINEALRGELRTALHLDPRMAPFRDDPEIAALIAEPKKAAAVAPDDKSVAVLAFTNLSDDKANEYFSDGISEELLNVLAKVPGLKVTARTSSFFFKGKNLPMPEIGKQLGVAYVVEGSVRKSGNQVRITAQLIKATDGFHVWSDTFTRELTEVFAVQDEIAGLIAKNLSLKLGTSSAVATAPVNPQAFELYVQARQAWNLRSADGLARAEQLLNRAVELAPDFVRAHAALVDVALVRADRAGLIGAFTQRHSTEQVRIVAQIERVLALDPELAETHTSLGGMLAHGWNFGEAERELRVAVSLNPNYATAHHWLGLALFATGQMDEALAETKLSTELDPLSPAILVNQGWAFDAVGRYREALAFAERALALQPDYAEALGAKAQALVRLGRFAEAIAVVRQLPAGKANTIGCRIVVFGQSGLKTEAEALLSELSVRCYWPKSYLLLAIGRPNEALAALDGASISSIDDCLPLFCDPLYDTIRDDPRFAKFLATLGLTEAHARAQEWRKAHPPEQPAAK